MKINAKAQGLIKFETISHIKQKMHPLLLLPDIQAKLSPFEIKRWNISLKINTVCKFIEIKSERYTEKGPIMWGIDFKP